MIPAANKNRLRGTQAARRRHGAIGVYSLKVALIQPSNNHYIGFHHTAITEPLGLEAVAGALRSHEVSLLDMRFDHDILRFLRRTKPDAVGVAIPFTTLVYAGRDVLSKVRDELPGAFTFVGGHHAALSPADFIDGCDVVVTGEGEEVAPDLLDCVESGESLEELSGLTFLSDGRLFSTGDRALINPLDSLPDINRSIVTPYADRYFFRGMSPVSVIETTRGCPHRCTFCSVWKFNRGRYRHKSPQRVLDEVRKTPTDNILFADDNFMGSVSRTEQICDLLQNAGLKKSYACQARTDVIAHNPGLIKRWRDIGLKWVLIGFESFDENQLSLLNKKTDVETNEAAVRTLQDNGIEIQAAFIVDPSYGRNEFRSLGKYIRRLKLQSCQITVLTPLPGTDLFEQLKSEITNKNYALFDFFHAVLPTKLPLEDFYKEFCRLYRQVAIAPGVKHFFKSPSNLSLTNVAHGINMFNNMLRAKAYIKGHHQVPPV